MESAGANFSDTIQLYVSTTNGATPASFVIKIYDGSPRLMQPLLLLTT
jgi:hypothetical protein